MPAASQQPLAAASTQPLKRRRRSGDYVKLTIRLTPAESAALIASAEAAGWSRAELVARLVRHPGIGNAAAHLLRALSDSNRQLLAIGRNLNQAARQINEHPGAMTSADREAIRAAVEAVQAHVPQSAALLGDLSATRRSVAHAQAQPAKRSRKSAAD
jgi:hypothetical protein